MSEIEKMYENAGIKEGCTLPNLCRYKGICAKPVNCEHYDYPFFTAEKQLELIKWLGKNKNGFNVFYDTSFNSKEKQYWCCADQWYEDFNYCCHKTEFDEALAELVNTLWQDLTEQERTEIAEILKG